MYLISYKIINKIIRESQEMRKILYEKNVLIQLIKPELVFF